MKTYKVYKYTCAVTGKGYIGQTYKSLEKRAGNGFIKYQTSPAFWNAIQKYGVENFSAEILHDGLTLEQANELEQVEIEKHNTLSPNGYNATTGGLNGSPSDETKRKIGNANRGKPSWAKGRKRSKEHSENISKGLKGKKRKPLSDEHRAKIGNAHRGMKRSAETRRKQSEAQKGKKHSPETLEKMKKRKPYWKGKKLSDEHRKKLSDAAKARCKRERENPLQLKLFED